MAVRHIEDRKICKYWVSAEAIDRYACAKSGEIKSSMVCCRIATVYFDGDTDRLYAEYDEEAECWAIFAYVDRAEGNRLKNFFDMIEEVCKEF